MIRRIHLLMMLCFFIQFVSAQRPVSSKDSVEVNILLAKVDDYLDRKENDSALILSAEVEKLAHSLRLPRLQGWAMSRSIEALIETRDLDSAEHLLDRLSPIATTVTDSLLHYVCLMQWGQVRMYQDKIDEAILLLDKSISSGLGKFTNAYLALAFNDLGFAWGQKGEYDRQALFTLKALGVYEKINSVAGMAMALDNLSTVYYQIGDNKKAIDYGLRSFKYREQLGDISMLSLICGNLSQYYLSVNMEDAERYRNLCVKYAEQSGNPDRILQSYITSSLVANKKKNNKEAMEYEQKVITMLERAGDNNRMLARRYIAAAFYSEVLNYDSTIILGYYNKSIRLSTSMDYKSNLKDLYLYLSEYYRKKNNFSEAYSNYKKHILYRDSLVNLEKQQMIAELENRYETNRKDIEILRLNSQQQIKQLEIEKQKAIIAGNTAVALQKQNEIDLLSKTKELQGIKIARQQEELQRQSLLSANNAQQVQIAAKETQLKERQIKTQKLVRNLLVGVLLLLLLLGFTFFNRLRLKKKLEQEKSLQKIRNDISRDLHDDIGASLSNINILNEMAKRHIGNPDTSKAYLEKASEDIQRISESISDIVWNINPRYDDMQNLFVRMKRYAADMFDGKNINGHFIFPADESNLKMGMAQRREFYLVFKEVVNNLAKYSMASNAWIRVVAAEGMISLEVSDDGKGFDKNQVKKGNGLQNMEQRARAAGGSLSIDSHPGNGTRVLLSMPMG